MRVNSRDLGRSIRSLVKSGRVDDSDHSVAHGVTNAHRPERTPAAHGVPPCRKPGESAVDMLLGWCVAYASLTRGRCWRTRIGEPAGQRRTCKQPSTFVHWCIAVHIAWCHNAMHEAVWCNELDGDVVDEGVPIKSGDNDWWTTGIFLGRRVPSQTTISPSFCGEGSVGEDRSS